MEELLIHISRPHDYVCCGFNLKNQTKKQVNALTKTSQWNEEHN